MYQKMYFVVRRHWNSFFRTKIKYNLIGNLNKETYVKYLGIDQETVVLRTSSGNMKTKLISSHQNFLFDMKLNISFGISFIIFLHS